ncbi:MULTISPECIES: glycosyltransferase [unclassified Micromonospora]|uniref:glycosyltransferase n=1 Tax=unclassified Micromonospora TaxID=2617518 RepID=UPI00363DACE3
MTASAAWQAQNPVVLAAAGAGSIVLAADPFCRCAAPDYWTWSENAHRTVMDAVAALDEPEADPLVTRLGADPTDPRAYRALVGVLADRLRVGDDAAAKLAQAIWDAECVSRLRYHVGDAHPHPQAYPVVDAAELLGRLVTPPHHRTDPVDAAVIIPFRAADDTTGRVRNLAATLNALHDQTHPRHRYRVVVVETDSRPRWRDLLAEACDVYVFARDPGRFNKSWAVNCGVVHGARPADAVCVLDADILVDRDFVARAVNRFQVPGTQAHWPFEDMLFLDAASSLSAVHRRCLDGAAAVDQAAARGVVLRRPPGGCLWLRESLYRRIGGMDERFCGWGGEDQDLVWRAERYGPLDRHQDPIVHLDHQRSPHRGEHGVPFYAEISFCSWPCDAEFGDLRRNDAG